MAVYFVATTGDNGNDGAASSPWRTINHAPRADLAPGDEVVKAGTYTEQLGIKQGGSDDHYLTIRSEVPGGARIRPPEALETNFHSIYVQDIVLQ